MTDIVQLLPDSIANQIAAGEVVQRPASVVKELMENAIDAGADEIRLIIKDSGKTLIRVIDNGTGMSVTDARMSFERHATSKIRKAEDLYSIRTMGFRGEALASIAAVSHVKLVTKPKSEELGTAIEIEGAKFEKQEPESCTDGTSVSVKNLFYNIPARRNFLKSDAVEFKHIVEEFQKIALSNSEVSLSLHHNDNEIYNLQGSKLGQRIISIFGKGYKEQLAACSEETEHVSIKGYIGKPAFARKTRGEQYFFVNNRFIKSNYLNHAVLMAYEGLLAEKSYPFYVLFIEIDPRHIDVNVHPTKTEIKFDDERTIYGIVRAAVKSALAKHNITPSLDFEQDVNFGQRRKVAAETIRDKFYGQFKMTPHQRSNIDHWERLFEEKIDRSSLNFDEEESGEKGLTMKFQSAANDLTQAGKEKELKDDSRSNKTFQLHNRYIVTQVKSGMMLIDQRAAHERVLFEKYLTHLENKSGSSQQSLFPQNIELNPADYALVIDLEEEIKALGFDFESFGKNSIIVNGIPVDLANMNEKELFEGLLEQYKHNKSNLTVSTRENLARSLARRSAINHGVSLNTEEMVSIIDHLFGCSNPNHAPDGRVTFCILDLNKIANYFN